MCQEVKTSPLDRLGMPNSQVTMSSTSYLEHMCPDAEMIPGERLGWRYRVVSLKRVFQTLGLGVIT